MVALELGDTCVELLEEKDLEDPGALGDRLERAVEDRHHRRVVLDLSRLRKITSAAFAVLVGAEERGATRGTPVAFACARLGVRRALAGLRRLLTIHGSVGRALEAISEAEGGLPLRAGRSRPHRGARSTAGIARTQTGALRRDGPEESQRKERAMDDERMDGVGPEDPRPQEEEDEKQEKEEEKPEAEEAVPPRELPASVMRLLEESAPELARALPPLTRAPCGADLTGQHETDPVEEAPPEELPEAAEPPVPEVPASELSEVPPEEAPAEVPPEPPAPPKKAARKRASGGRKKAKGHRKPRGKATKGRSKSKKKARA